MKKKKSQVWFLDFMVGITIFLIVIAIYFKYANNLTEDPSKKNAELIMDAKSISSALVTKGAPNPWNQTTVNVIGLTDGRQRIEDNKLLLFSNISYSDAKLKLRTTYEYYFSLEYLNKTPILIDGKDGIGKAPLDVKNSVVIKRVLIYNSSLVNLVVNIWE